MVASYPRTPKDFIKKHDILDTVNAVDVNELQDEVKAIQNVLGSNPHQRVGDGDSTTPFGWQNVGQRLQFLHWGQDHFPFYLYGGEIKLGANESKAYAFAMNDPSESQNPNNMRYGSAGFKARHGGWFNITANCYFHENSNDDGVRRLTLRYNGSTIAGQDVAPGEWASVSITYPMAEGSHMEMCLRNTASRSQLVSSRRFGAFQIRQNVPASKVTWV